MNRNRQQSLTPGPGHRTIQIPFKAPYDWIPIIGFLQPRAIPGLEIVSSKSYKRAFKIGSSSGVLEVRPSLEGHCLDLTLPDGPRSDLGRITARVARLFDCDADPLPIYRHLSGQRLLTNVAALSPGIRVPGAFDGFEIAVRAVLGQQVSVRAATTMAGRLVACYGSPLGESGLGEMARLFPSSEALVNADLTRIGLTRAKAKAIAGLAEAHLAEPALFEPSSDPAAAIARLVEIPGVGQWTAQYIAIRSLKDPDGFPASDLGLLRAVSGGGDLISPKELEERSAAWRPWRAYAAMHLWASLGRVKSEE